MHPLLKLLNSKNFRTYSVHLAKKIGSVNAAIMLSELIYFYDRYDEERSLVQIRNQIGDWFYLTQEKCEDRTALSRKEQDTAIKKLEDMGLLKKTLAGLPAKRYFQLNEQKIFELLMEIESFRYTSSDSKNANKLNKVNNKIEHDFDTDNLVAQKGQTRVFTENQRFNEDPVSLLEKNNPVAQNGQTGCAKGTNRIDPIGQYTKETKKETRLRKTTNYKKESDSSSFIDRDLKELSEVGLNPSQKHTLYKEFDDTTILAAFCYYKSCGKEPNDLGAFLYSACKKGWKKSAGKEDKILINKSLAKTKIGCFDGQAVKGFLINLLSKGIEFVSGQNVQFLNYDDTDFVAKLKTWTNRIQPEIAF